MKRFGWKPVIGGMAAVSLAAVGLLLFSWRHPAQAAPGAGLTHAEIQTILNHAIAAANDTDSTLRQVNGAATKTKMHIIVVDRQGKPIGAFSMPDAWVGSLDIAIAKARTAAFFSSDENALTSRVIGELSQPGGPLWGIWDSNEPGISGSASTRNGLIPFPGGVPLYKNGQLVGGVGVSGDGVDQDEHVAFAGAVGFEPGSIGKLGF